MDRARGHTRDILPQNLPETIHTTAKSGPLTYLLTAARHAVDDKTDSNESTIGRAMASCCSSYRHSIQVDQPSQCPAMVEAVRATQSIAVHRAIHAPTRGVQRIKP